MTGFANQTRWVLFSYISRPLLIFITLGFLPAVVVSLIRAPDAMRYLRIGQIVLAAWMINLHLAAITELALKGVQYRVVPHLRRVISLANLILVLALIVGCALGLRYMGVAESVAWIVPAAYVLSYYSYIYRPNDWRRHVISIPIANFLFAGYAIAIFRIGDDSPVLKPFFAGEIPWLTFLFGLIALDGAVILIRNIFNQGYRGEQPPETETRRLFWRNQPSWRYPEWLLQWENRSIERWAQAARAPGWLGTVHKLAGGDGYAGMGLRCAVPVFGVGLFLLVSIEQRWRSQPAFFFLGTMLAVGFFVFGIIAASNSMRRRVLHLSREITLPVSRGNLQTGLVAVLLGNLLPNILAIAIVFAVTLQPKGQSGFDWNLFFRDFGAFFVSANLLIVGIAGMHVVIHRWWIAAALLMIMFVFVLQAGVWTSFAGPSRITLYFLLGMCAMLGTFLCLHSMGLWFHLEIGRRPADA